MESQTAEKSDNDLIETLRVRLEVRHAIYSIEGTLRAEIDRLRELVKNELSAKLRLRHELTSSLVTGKLLREKLLATEQRAAIAAHELSITQSALRSADARVQTLTRELLLLKVATPDHIDTNTEGALREQLANMTKLAVKRGKKLDEIAATLNWT